jgi:hypothetical protein
MKLEQQVCSLELAKKLKELGVKQESYFYWEDWEDERHIAHYMVDTGDFEQYERVKSKYPNIVSAFTVAELGEMLPNMLFDKFFLSITRIGTTWIIQYSFGLDIEAHAQADTEADARAKCLVYLLENKLITL